MTRYTHDGDSTVSSTASSTALQHKVDIEKDRCPIVAKQDDTRDDEKIKLRKQPTQPTIKNIAAARMRGGYESDSASDTDSISQHSNNDGVESTVETTPSDKHERRNEVSKTSTIPSTITITMSDATTTRTGYRIPVDNHTIVKQITDTIDKRQYYTPDEEGDNTIYHVNHADAIGGHLLTEKQEGLSLIHI